MLLLFASFTCLGLWLLRLSQNFAFTEPHLAGSLLLLSDVQIDKANYHNSAFLAVVKGTKDVETRSKNNNIHMLQPKLLPDASRSKWFERPPRI